MNRYLPIYEKVSNVFKYFSIFSLFIFHPLFFQILKANGGFIVGKRISLADIALLEVLLWIEELLSEELKPYPELQGLVY